MILFFEINLWRSRKTQHVYSTPESCTLHHFDVDGVWVPTISLNILFEHAESFRGTNLLSNQSFYIQQWSIWVKNKTDLLCFVHFSHLPWATAEKYAVPVWTRFTSQKPICLEHLSKDRTSSKFLALKQNVPIKAALDREGNLIHHTAAGPGPCDLPGVSALW